MDVANIAALAAKTSPHGNGLVPIIPDRTLYADGDGLAYYCAGNDSTTVGEARENLTQKLLSAQRAAGAGRVKILLTGSGSTKGDRYAIARVKPYQGQRSNSRRPANWQALREFMESGKVSNFPVEITYSAEADDLFGHYAHRNPACTVIYTQDKDMRMLPGFHLEWVNHLLVYVPSWPSRQLVDSPVIGDKQYGPKWFWLQMLHGDQADNIPGLPRYVDTSGKAKPVGEVTAGKLLEGGDNDWGTSVELAYRSYYGDRWLVEMLEQACLLWMRREPDLWQDCLAKGGPLHEYVGCSSFEAAFQEIEKRVLDARKYNTPEDDSGCGDPPETTD